ncbi:UNVERIFIED_CONTAM: hypothetical protein FKN15_052155 [Acipenser sinensis]
MLAAGNGMVLEFELYQGKGGDTGDKKLTQGQAVVARLTARLEEGTYVYFDRFFTSLKLGDFLLQKGLFCTGTLMRNRLPKNNKLLRTKYLERKGRGSTDMVFRKDKEVAIIKWYDKEILLASTCDSLETQVQLLVPVLQYTLRAAPLCDYTQSRTKLSPRCTLAQHCALPCTAILIAYRSHSILRCISNVFYLTQCPRCFCTCGA